MCSGELDAQVGDTLTGIRHAVLLPEDAGITVPKGVVHQLINWSRKPAVLIETQQGDVISEDDIVRLDDVYGRV